MPSLSLGLGFARGSSFNPSNLFTSGSRGFFYDFSDYSTQFTDTAGTTAITGVGQSLGLVLDKSAGLALGPEVLTNNSFDSGSTGWDVVGADATHIATFSGGTLRYQSDTTTPQLIVQQNLVLTIGKTYLIEVTVSSWTSGSIKTDSFGGNTVLATGVGTRQFRVTATATSFQITRNSVNVDLTVDYVSVRELPGNHATQATAGSRPLTTTIGTGFRGIQFDGVDDFLQTAAIDFSNSDKMTVVAGVRKLSDAAQAILVELTTTAGATPQSFNLQVPGPATSYRFVSGGSATAAGLVDATGFAAPESAVISALGDISGDRSTLLRNGVQVGQSIADQGTGNYANAAVYIGRRAGSSLPFNGVLTFLCVINRTLTAGELAALESFANSRTGAY